ncbi:MAG: energy-converting hydrogenase subunit [Thermoproteota archaeon]|nr:energy-converting hydrogenase subunit [Thermoproteota archaeon]
MVNSQRGDGVFVSDCEGPLSKNDNAFEIAAKFIPEGGRLFQLLSKYDDVLAEIVKKSGYRAGYTLALIAPFLKAHNVTNREISDFSARNIVLIQGAMQLLRRVMEAIPSFIVSTSYEQYIFSICTLVGFPFENVYCTRLDVDKYFIDGEEKKKLKKFEKEILNLSMIEIPNNTKSINDLSSESQETVERLDNIFLKEIPSMASYAILKDIKPLGGEEKADSVRSIIERLHCNLSDVIYVGDSITDVRVLQLVRAGKGLAISFNGNMYAVRNADVAVLSENAIVTSVLVDVFSKSGRDDVLSLVRDWSYYSLKKYCSDKTLVETIARTYGTALPKVELVTRDNVEGLVKDSSAFRKTVRGEAIGRLG